MALVAFTGIKEYKGETVKSPIDVRSAIAAARREGAMQAARDVLSLLPLADLHARNCADFYLRPSTGGVEPKITVYLLEDGAVKDGVLHGYMSMKTVGAGGYNTYINTMTLPQLVEASRQEVANALRQIGLGLSLQWDDTAIEHMIRPGVYASSNAVLLHVSWA